MRLSRIHRGLLPSSAALALLAGCATPVFKEAPSAIVTPLEIARQPASHDGTDVVWGGKILDVRNGSNRTEIQVVAYPLDAAQRPDPDAPTLGRFVVALPGFVEPLDYPAGRFVTLRGRVAASATKRIDERDLVLPIVADATIHLWPVNFPRERPRVSFGIGIGAGFR
ncbi:MAG TPA: Slp family lipoprotein [Rhodanobacteraceae bacterium]|nr:Slp family lipoprotein [Rhodanobacteraceae bacterium]